VNVTAAAIGSQSLRSRRSPQTAEIVAQPMNPNAPTATMRPASGGAYPRAARIDVNPEAKP
jgi:hypothetical protein